MDRTRSMTRLVIGMLTAIAVVGCGGAPGVPASSPAPAAVDKAGQTPVVTLRLGTEDDEGRPGAEQIRHFADEVKALSDGRIVIQPVWDANGDDVVGGWDQVVAKLLLAGKLDMANIPARAWDTLGVTSLRALQAPFLVTSDELAGRIAQSDLAPELLSGLETIGVTGLALEPESLRHLLLIDEVPTTVKDFEGMVIRSPRSATIWATFKGSGRDSG